MDMVAPLSIRWGDVLLIDLDPTRGGEIRKRRPCLEVSPDQLNAHLETSIVDRDRVVTTFGRLSSRITSSALTVLREVFPE